MKYLSALFIGLALFAATQLTLAQPTNPSILLRNVLLSDKEGGADKTVNVVVRDNKLDIITEDLIPLDQADEVYDAGGGVILGQLTLGELASFMILDGDPRQDIDILLDTKTTK